MQGYRFYLEFESPKHKRQKLHSGNVFAMLLAKGQPVYFRSGDTNCVEGLGAVFFEPNSPVASTSSALEYIQKQCKRISEVDARTIHPALFERLDDPC